RVRRNRCRRAAVEIFVLLELLTDQGGADHLAVFLDQAALCLFRKDRARDGGHGERIGQARDQREQHEEEDGRTDFTKHGVSPEFSSLRAKRPIDEAAKEGWIASSLRS